VCLCDYEEIIQLAHHLQHYKAIAVLIQDYYLLAEGYYRSVKNVSGVLPPYDKY